MITKKIMFVKSHYHHPEIVIGADSVNSNSTEISGCLKCSFSSSGSFGFCQTFDVYLLKRFILIVNGRLLISYDKV